MTVPDPSWSWRLGLHAQDLDEDGHDTGTTVITTGGLVPYYIAPANTYAIPLYRQALFSMPIVVDGTLVVDGYLVMVD